MAREYHEACTSQHTWNLHVQNEAPMGLETLTSVSRVAIVSLGAKHHCTPMLLTLLGLWCTGNPKRVAQLEARGELLQLVRNLLPELERAQSQRIEPARSHLADHEILEVVGLPLALK